MTERQTAVVVAARRSAIATKGARFADLAVDELAAPVLRACLDDARRSTGFSAPVDDVLLGNCMGPGGNPARVAALAAGFDVAVTGMTLDRQCGSGLSAIVTAAESIAAGSAQMIVAGGVESASTAPVRTAAGVAYARAAFAPAGFPDPEMGPAAEALAARYGIGRDLQDAYAARSHDQALAAQRDGAFDDEIVEIAGIRTDDGPRRGMPSMLARFAPLYSAPDRPATGPGAPTVTAGNSCRISDGAAAVVLVGHADRASAPGLALIGSATVGCDPAFPGIGPVDAVTRALAVAGVALDDVAAFEIVEAFAAQTLSVLHGLGLMRDGIADPRVCAEGGALALGHPWGASGAVGVVRLFSRLVRAGAPSGTIGVATAAIGGGMGVAAVFEVVR